MLGRAARRLARTSPRLVAPLPDCSRPCALTSQRCWLSSNSNNEKSDEQLQQAFGLWNRFMAIPDVVNEDNIRLAMKLVNDGTIVDAVQAGALLVDLQNPLLLKYGFDVEEFIKGVQTAVPLLTEKIYSLEVAEMRATGGPASEETLSLLRDTLCTSLYDSVTHAHPDTDSEEIATNLEFRPCAIEEVQTYVVSDKWRNYMDGQARSMRMVLSYKGGNPHDSEALHGMLSSHVDDSSAPPTTPAVDLLPCDLLPVGSVVAFALVSVDYIKKFIRIPHRLENVEANSNAEISADAVSAVGDKAVEVIGQPAKDDAATLEPPSSIPGTPATGAAEGKEEQEEQEEIVRRQWLFEACISGQVERAWVVRSFDAKAEADLPFRP